MKTETVAELLRRAGFDPREYDDSVRAALLELLTLRELRVGEVLGRIEQAHRERERVRALNELEARQDAANLELERTREQRRELELELED